MKSSFLISLVIFSFIGCSNTKKTATQNKPAAEQALAPGTAMVEFQVLEITPSDDGKTSLYQVKILTVLKYGPSTPIIDIESIHSLKLLNNKYQETLKKGTKTAAVLSHEEQIAQYAQQSNWKLLYLKN